MSYRYLIFYTAIRDKNGDTIVGNAEAKLSEAIRSWEQITVLQLSIAAREHLHQVVISGYQLLRVEVE